MVDKLWDDFGRGENERVPITFATDEYVWLSLTGNSFREFYTDAQVQLSVLLAGDSWFRENIVHDRRRGPPEGAWTVAPRWWMDEPEIFGCEVVIQEDDFAWSRPLEESKGDLLARLAELDMREAVRQSRLWQLYEAMVEAADEMTYRGLPVRVGFPGGTHGVFTIACRVRGEERLCVDMAEDPDFAFEFIGVITDRTEERLRAWHELAETGAEIPSPDGWGTADDSLQFISREMYEQFVLPHHERLFSAMTTGKRHMHLCGYAEQHFEALYHKLGIRSLDGPGPFVDHGSALAAMPELVISAQADHTITMLGPASEIDAMMRDMLTDGAKQPGRFSISGFLARQTPLEHVRAMYEAGRRYGTIGGQGAGVRDQG